MTDFEKLESMALEKEIEDLWRRCKPRSSEERQQITKAYYTMKIVKARLFESDTGQVAMARMN